MPGSVQAIMIFSCISPPTLLFNLGTFQVYMQREVMFELSLEYGGESGEKNASTVMSTRKKSVVQITIMSTLLPWCEMAKRSISYFFFPISVCIYLFVYLCQSLVCIFSELCWSMGNDFETCIQQVNGLYARWEFIKVIIRCNSHEKAIKIFDFQII